MLTFYLLATLDIRSVLINKGKDRTKIYSMYKENLWRFPFVYIAIIEKGRSQHGCQSVSYFPMDGYFLSREFLCYS